MLVFLQSGFLESFDMYVFFRRHGPKGRGAPLYARMFAQRILGRLKGETRLRMRVILHSVFGR